MEIDKIKRVVSDKASGEEREEVRAWMEGAEERKCFLENAKAYYREEIASDRMENQSLKRIRQRIPLFWNRRHTIGWYEWFSVVACAAIVIWIFIWLVPAGKQDEQRLVHSAMPPRSAAVQLILSDGSLHRLSSLGAVQARIPGFKVGQGVTVQERQFINSSVVRSLCYNEIIVPSGGEYSLLLADGTTVILNSQTRLRFPDSFTGKVRRVYLSGEAYFDVVRNENHPFLVEFEGGKVCVLGTRFNVKAYRGKNTFTTLVSGKVKVASARDSVLLQPGELCEMDASDFSLAVREADMMVELAWKNGEFVFKNVSLGQIMDELARWYDAEIEYDSSELQGIKLHVYMDRTKTLDEALEIIAKLGNISYDREGKKIMIKKR